MKASKLVIYILFLMACTTEPMTPITGNEPGDYPDDFLATTQSNTSILVSWKDASDVTQYLVQAKTGAGTFVSVIDGLSVSNDADWSDNNAVANVVQGVKQVMFTGLTAGASYDFVIHPYNTRAIPNPDYKTDGTAPTSSATTSNEVVVEPSAHVTDLKAVALSNSSIKVSWIDASKVDKYVLLAKTGGGSFVPVTDGTLVADDTDWTDHNGALNVNQSVQEVIFTGLTENTSYDFTIYPYNEGGDPDPNFKTDGDVPTASTSTSTDEPLAHVTSLAATALSNTSLKVSWTDASDVDKYVLLAKTGEGSFVPVTDGTLVIDDIDWNNNNGALNVDQSVQEVIFSGLAKNTVYDFTIYPYNESGDPDPNYKTDETIPFVSGSTLNEASSAFDQTLVSVVSVDVTGSPFDITQYEFADKVFPQVSDGFAYAPKIVMAPDNSGSYAIAWSDASAKNINLTLFNSDDTRNGSDHKLITNAEGLGGFALNGNSYVLGHISGTKLEKYTIQNFNSAFTSTFSTDLTGTTSLDQTWSKQAPVDFGSARIVVDQTAAQIGVFLSHEMLWDDGIRHQGGLIKFLDLNGNVLGGAGNKGSDAIGGSFWFISHNVDTRMVAQNGVFGVVGNGDAVPRALAGRVIENGTWKNKASIFAIDGSIGDNDTKTQLGGLVPITGGEYILTFSSEVGRMSRDVNFMRLGADLNGISQAWLTSFGSNDEYAINVKTAKYGNNFVIAWEQVSAVNPGVFKAMFAVVDTNGAIVEAPQQFSNIRFNRGDDFINYANGDVGWAIGSGSTLKVYRLKFIDLAG